MTFTLAIHTAYTATNAAITIRKRLPGTYPTSGAAAAAGIKYLKQHPIAMGFEIEPQGLEAANDAALHRQTITRATLARRARQAAKVAPQVAGCDAKKREVQP